MEDELHLAGGNVSGEVVLVGSTVRKAWTDASPSVQAFMHAVRARGVDVPAPLGRDEQGRQVVEFVPGHLAMHTELTLAERHRVGSMVRAVHDASVHFIPAPDAVWETASPGPRCSTTATATTGRQSRSTSPPAKPCGPMRSTDSTDDPSAGRFIGEGHLDNARTRTVRSMVRQAAR